MNNLQITDLIEKYKKVMLQVDQSDLLDVMFIQYLLEVEALSKKWILTDDRDFIYHRFHSRQEAVEYNKNMQSNYQIMKLP